MPYSTSVKYFHSGMAGVPSLTGAAGALIAVLDACLANGFGSQNATISVSGGVATVVLSNVNSNPFDDHTVAALSGATPSGLNGEKRVLTKTSTGFTFEATGISDGPASGTIAVKMAAAGWSKLFSGTNLGAYQSLNAQSTKCVVRFDDTGATNARVVSYESMTDINTGVGTPCPTNTQFSGGLYWPKASAAAGTARSWVLVADDRTVYFKINTLPSGSQECGLCIGFGDFIPTRSSDAFAFCLFAPSSDVTTSTNLVTAGLARSSYAGNSSEPLTFLMQKSYTGIGSSVTGGKFQESYALRTNFSADAYSGNLSNGGFTYPNPVDNSLVLSRYAVFEGNPNTTTISVALRGGLRGVNFCVSTGPSPGLGSQFNTFDKIDGTGTLAGRKLLAVKGNTPGSNTQDGTLYFFDITGPWG